MKKLIVRLTRAPSISWILQRRFLKFGVVGASGTAVNLGVLYLSQEYLFTAIISPATRLNASLACAIFLATINNFIWNRKWTWRDRRHHHDGKPVVLQFFQYALACWFSIALQALFTKILAVHIYYLTANLFAILLASVFNFIANDLWTFAHRKPRAAGDNPIPEGDTIKRGRSGREAGSADRPNPGEPAGR
jgi:dolichol-phosphate mannosyltransferase